MATEEIRAKLTDIQSIEYTIHNVTHTQRNDSKEEKGGGKKGQDSAQAWLCIRMLRTQFF